VAGVNRQRADRVVGLLVAAVLVFGGFLAWGAYRQSQAIDGMMGSMMGTSTGAVHGPNPLWYGLGTLLVAAVVGGLYLAVRDDLAPPDDLVPPGTGGADRRSGDEDRRPMGEESAARHPEPAGSDRAPGDPAGTEPPAADPSEPSDPGAQPTRRVLDLLPEDERRVLAPVIESPGITQIELRDRSDFSKSKVSQTVSGLEKRGLLYRERQGRTYRVYPSDDLRDST
jgi:hypothetical protein